MTLTVRSQPGTSGSTTHGVRVAMSSHPATTQDCKLRTNDWITPSGLTNSCVFCLKCLTGCFKCPGCEVLACRNCLAEIMGRERDRAFAGLVRARLITRRAAKTSGIRVACLGRRCSISCLGVEFSHYGHVLHGQSRLCASQQ
jgi:hypothetical protein